MSETTKTLEYYLSLPYPIEIIPDSDGDWFARIPLLQEWTINGADRAKALELIDDAKRLWLETTLVLEIAATARVSQSKTRRALLPIQPQLRAHPPCRCLAFCDSLRRRIVRAR